MKFILLKHLSIFVYTKCNYEQAIEELNKAIEIYPELNAVNLRNNYEYFLNKEIYGGSE